MIQLYQVLSLFAFDFESSSSFYFTDLSRVSDFRSLAMTLTVIACFSGHSLWLIDEISSAYNYVMKKFYCNNIGYQLSSFSALDFDSPSSFSCADLSRASDSRSLAISLTVNACFSGNSLRLIDEFSSMSSS